MMKKKEIENFAKAFAGYSLEDIVYTSKTHFLFELGYNSNDTVPVRAGAVIIPRIEKHLCFGYGMNLQHTEEESKHAWNMASYVRTNEGFKEYQTSYLTKTIKMLKKALAEKEYIFLGCYSTYPARFITYFVTADSYRASQDGFILASQEQVNNYIAALHTVKERFEKKIDAYLKRYGTEKIRAYAYLID